jgi:hypothetical protein
MHIPSSQMATDHTTAQQIPLKSQMAAALPNSEVKLGQQTTKSKITFCTL